MLGPCFVMKCCLVAVSVLCLFLTVPWVGLQCVIVIPQELEVLSLSHLYSLKTKISQCHYVMTL